MSYSTDKMMALLMQSPSEAAPLNPAAAETKSSVRESLVDTSHLNCITWWCSFYR